MASTFDIGGGPRNKKNLVSDCPGGGGVHGNPIWPMDYNGINTIIAKIEYTPLLLKVRSCFDRDDSEKTDVGTSPILWVRLQQKGHPNVIYSCVRA